MNERTHVDLFTGLGGFSLAAAANGVRTVAQCECEPFLAEGLERTWGVPVCRDVRKFDGGQWRGAWLVTAGVPCQPASRAGKQRGASDDRWLWGEAIRVVKESEPAWFLFENPPGILDVGLDGILADLEGLKYEAQPISIPACAVNSPQDRERIWILGHRTGAGRKGSDAAFSRRDQTALPNQLKTSLWPACRAEDSQCAGGAPGQPGLGLLGSENEPVADGEKQHGTEHRRETSEHRRSAPDCTLADGECQRRDGRCVQECERQEWACGGVAGSAPLGAWRDYEWLPCPDPKRGTVLRRAPTGLYDLAHGLQLALPKGVCGKLLEALGNSIVPQVASEIIRAMIEAERHYDL